MNKNQDQNSPSTQSGLPSQTEQGFPDTNLNPDRIINNCEELREALADGLKHFRVRYARTHSPKTITQSGKNHFGICDWINGSRQVLDEKELYTKSDIGNAMDNGNFVGEEASASKSEAHQTPTDDSTSAVCGSFPRIYVACLAAYNAGILHGRWINAAQDAEDIRKEIAEMLKKSPEPFAEEWAIHDYEGFGDYRVSESEDIDEIAAIAAQIEDHGEAYLAALSLSSNRAEADTLMEEYCGEYNSDEEFTRQLLEDTDSLPKDLPFYIHIDWSWTAKEIMMDYAEYNGHYFRQC